MKDHGRHTCNKQWRIVKKEMKRRHNLFPSRNQVLYPCLKGVYVICDELARGIKWRNQTTHRLHIVSCFHGCIFYLFRRGSLSKESWKEVGDDDSIAQATGI